MIIRLVLKLLLINSNYQRSSSSEACTLSDILHQANLLLTKFGEKVKNANYDYQLSYIDHLHIYVYLTLKRLLALATTRKHQRFMRHKFFLHFTAVLEYMFH